MRGDHQAVGPALGNRRVVVAGDELSDGRRAGVVEDLDVEHGADRDIDKNIRQVPRPPRGRTMAAMRDDDCVRFLQWALPRLGMRWGGFRKVRRQVCRRLGRRMAELGVGGIEEYRERLDAEPDEWRELDRMCRVTISRFWRDRGTFRALEETVLPALAHAAVRAGDEHLDAWSCGCASGEEPYSLAILWHERLRPRYPGLRLRILATDLDLHLLRRAGRGVYPEGAVRDLPEELAEAALDPVPPSAANRSAEPASGSAKRELRVADRYRPYVHRVRHDVRDPAPAGPFHLVLCRNLAFTYFDEELQQTVAAHLAETLHPGGALVLGSHEELPTGAPDLHPWLPEASIYRRVGKTGLSPATAGGT